MSIGEWARDRQGMGATLSHRADMSRGPALQRLLAIANGAPIPEDATHVPLEFRRER